MNPVLERIKHANGLADDAPIGVRACISSVELITKANTRDVVGIATTDAIDSESEVVLPEGADTTYFAANRKVFVDHWTTMDHCVGTLRSMKLDTSSALKGWRVRIALAREGTNELADFVAAMAADTGIGLSIGFMATNYGPPTPEEAKRYPGARTIIRNWEWYELSFTPFPCNVSCQAGAAADLMDGNSKSKMLERMQSKASASVRRKLGIEKTYQLLPRRIVIGF